MLNSTKLKVVNEFIKKVKGFSVNKICEMVSFDVVSLFRSVSPAQIFKKMKGFVSLSGVYKAVKRFKETGNCSPRVRSTPKRPVRTKNLISGRNYGGIVEEASENWLEKQALAQQPSTEY